VKMLILLAACLYITFGFLILYLICLFIVICLSIFFGYNPLDG